jgi:hypothetical protein
MAIDVNQDYPDHTIFDADDLEALFPGCVVRRGPAFTMNHDRLTQRFIMAIKATSDIDIDQFIRILRMSWDACEVNSIGEGSIQ